MTNNQLLSVNDINLYIKNLLQGDSLLCSLWVKGEISNFKHHSSGHMYFSLKDQSSSIRCVMFKSNAQKLNFEPAHGMQVIIAGYVSVYERDGNYQFYVDEMMMAGAGLLHVAYEKLKNKLEAEGLFAYQKKRALPNIPQAVGLVTSLSGAALRDMLSIIKRRNSQIQIYIAAATVQGQDGVASICKSLDRLYGLDLDVIIVGRGGGSLEELWCFNEEQVVRKVAGSPVPIISAVGHETDFTLTDFAADVRAATPSMAAELVAPMLHQLKSDLMEKQRLLMAVYGRMIEDKRRSLGYLAKNNLWLKPERLLSSQHQLVDERMDGLKKCMKDIFNQKRGMLELSASTLDALSPLKVLARGYCVGYQANGKVLQNSQEVSVGEAIRLQLSRGMLHCEVIDKEEETNG